MYKILDLAVELLEELNSQTVVYLSNFIFNLNFCQKWPIDSNMIPFNRMFSSLFDSLE